jgi:hypothetical protein
VERPWASGQARMRRYIGLTIRDIVDCADGLDRDEPSVQTVHGLSHCSANDPRPACDNRCCPTCQPENSPKPEDPFEERAAPLRENDGEVSRDQSEAGAAAEVWPELPNFLDRRRAAPEGTHRTRLSMTTSLKTEAVPAWAQPKETDDVLLGCS